MRVVLACVVVCAMTSRISAEIGPPVDLAAQAVNAAKVVVGRVLSVQASMEPNEFGDRVIVSHVFVQPEETLKGSATPVIEVVVDGGTIGDLTLRVSDMPVLRASDRAVFFLDAPSATGVHRPHRRGSGILTLDSQDRAHGGTLTLEEIRSTVRTATTRN